MTTDRGIDALRARISRTAHKLCDRLDRAHPIAADDSPSCYHTAMDDAAPQAIAAIDRARLGPSYREYRGDAYYENDAYYDNDGGN